MLLIVFFISFWGLTRAFFFIQILDILTIVLVNNLHPFGRKAQAIQQTGLWFKDSKRFSQVKLLSIFEPIITEAYVQA